MSRALKRVAELEQTLTLICGAFPTKLIMNGGVDKVCAELLAIRGELVMQLKANIASLDRLGENVTIPDPTNPTGPRQIVGKQFPFEDWAMFRARLLAFIEEAPK